MCVDAILIPILKKCDFRNCDNWRGISLLEVVGKVVARVVQQRLQRLAERVLPDSQCGFSGPHYSIHGLRVHTLACTFFNETHVIIFVPHCQLILIDVQYST